MNNEISALRIDLWDCEGKTPAEIVFPHIPENTVNKAWIPQTMGEQIWCLFEFKNEEERIEWESSLPPLIKKWLDRNLITHALSYGWHIRDINGFIKYVGESND